MEQNDSASVARGRQEISCVFMEKNAPADPQGTFKHEDNIGFGDRPDGDQADCALHARINSVAHAQNVAKHDFGHGSDGRVLKVKVESAAACRRLRTLVGDSTHLRAFERYGTAALAGT